jgi:hypothetical protein
MLKGTTQKLFRRYEIDNWINIAMEIEFASNWLGKNASSRSLM